MSGSAQQAQLRVGLACGLGAYLAWGFFPLMFRAVGSVPPDEILAQRIVWSVLFLVLVASITRRWPHIAQVLRSPRLIGALALSATLIAVNWLVFIISVERHHVLEASLGYFIIPLINISLATAFLGERFNITQLIAIALAAVGVLIMVIVGGSAPWVSLLLAITFSLYGLIRKLAQVAPLEGLIVETLLLFPFAAGYLWYLHAQGSGHFGANIVIDILLMSLGVVTAVPLMMFAAAAGRLNFSTLGLLQYVSPSLQFVIALAAFGETFRLVDAVTFGFIWLGIILYAADGARQHRRSALEEPEPLP